MHPNFRNIDSNGNMKEQALVSEGPLNMEGNEMLKNEKKSLDNHVFSNDEHNSVHQSPPRQWFYFWNQGRITGK